MEGDYTRGGAFALFHRPHPGAFRQLMHSHPGEFVHFFKKMILPRGLARGGAWALLELTDTLACNFSKGLFTWREGAPATRLTELLREG